MSARPITFSCREVLPSSPEQIFQQIARVESWCEFRGYGPLPGIATAQYESRTEKMKGSRIRVQNRDGSMHVEEITEWNPQERVVLQLHEFSPPLSWFSDRFVEEWDLAVSQGGTQVQRTVSLYPRSALTRMPLLAISLLLRRAVARHLHQMKSAPLS
jgi:hypothetical protein